MAKNVKVTKRDTVVDVLNCLLLENPMSNLSEMKLTSYLNEISTSTTEVTG